MSPIAPIFILSSLLLLMIQLLVWETRDCLTQLLDEVEAGFGHDTYIYPDYEP